MRMTTMIKKICIGSIVLAICNLSGVLKADAGQYLGDFCWNISRNFSGAVSSGTLQLGFENMGGSHYRCSGVSTVDAIINGKATTLQYPVFGNAEVLNNKFQITLTDQGKRFDSTGNYTVGIDMMTIILDPTTFSGTTEGFGIYSGGKTESSNGTVTITNCQ